MRNILLGFVFVQPKHSECPDLNNSIYIFCMVGLFVFCVSLITFFWEPLPNDVPMGIGQRMKNTFSFEEIFSHALIYYSGNFLQIICLKFVRHFFWLEFCEFFWPSLDLEMEIIFWSPRWLNPDFSFEKHGLFANYPFLLMYLFAECHWWIKSPITNLLLLVGCVSIFNAVTGQFICLWVRLLTLKCSTNYKLYSARHRRRIRKDSIQIEKRASVQFLELDSPMLAIEGIQNGCLEKHDGNNCIWVPSVAVKYYHLVMRYLYFSK